MYPPSQTQRHRLAAHRDARYGALDGLRQRERARPGHVRGIKRLVVREREHPETRRRRRQRRCGRVRRPVVGHRAAGQVRRIVAGGVPDRVVRARGGLRVAHRHRGAGGDRHAQGQRHRAGVHRNAAHRLHGAAHGHGEGARPRPRVHVQRLVVVQHELRVGNAGRQQLRHGPVLHRGVEERVDVRRLRPHAGPPQRVGVVTLHIRHVGFLVLLHCRGQRDSDRLATDRRRARPGDAARALVHLLGLHAEPAPRRRRVGVEVPVEGERQRRARRLRRHQHRWNRACRRARRRVGGEARDRVAVHALKLRADLLRVVRVVAHRDRPPGEDLRGAVLAVDAQGQRLPGDLRRRRSQVGDANAQVVGAVNENRILQLRQLRFGHRPEVLVEGQRHHRPGRVVHRHARDHRCVVVVSRSLAGNAGHTADQQDRAKHEPLRHQGAPGRRETRGNKRKKRDPREAALRYQAGTALPLATMRVALGVSRRAGSARLGSARLGSARLGSARLGSARLGSARLGSARLGSARLGSARLGSGIIKQPDTWPFVKSFSVNMVHTLIVSSLLFGLCADTIDLSILHTVTGLRLMERCAEYRYVHMTLAEQSWEYCVDIVFYYEDFGGIGEKMGLRVRNSPNSK